MKKKILTQFFLLSCLGIMYVTLRSDVNGKYNNGTSCGSCHGNVNAATSVLFSGIPATYVTGQSYPVTFTVSNSTNSKAGFNVAVSAGTLTAGTGSKVNGAKTQITHTAPMTMSGNSATFSFTWTAPTTLGTVTFSGAGNAVNGNNSDDSGDQWNVTTASSTGSFPAGLSENSKPAYSIYPNPVVDQLLLDGSDLRAARLTVMNLWGQVMPVRMERTARGLSFDCRSLSAGIYLLHGQIDGQSFTGSFSKQ